MKRIIPFFFIFFLPWTLLAQCPENIQVQKIVSQRDTNEIKTLIEQLSHCPLLKDSLAYAWHRLGVYFYLDNRMEQAIKATRQGLKIRNSNSNIPPSDLGQSNYNLGVFYREISQLDSAEKYFVKALALFESSDSAMTIDTGRELAIVANEKGDYEAALNHLQVAIQKANYINEPDYLADCYILFGKILLLKKNYQEAIDTLNKVEEVYKQYPDKSEGEPFSKAASYNNLAIAYDQLGNYAQALTYYNKSLAISKAVKWSELLFQNYNNMGIVYRKMGNFPAAIQTLKQVLQLAETYNDLNLMATCYDNLGDVYFDQKRFEVALSHYHKAILQSIPEFTTNNVYENPTDSLLKYRPNKEALITYFSDKAKCWKAYYQKKPSEQYLQQALINYQKADYLITAMRYEQRDQGSKLFWRSLTRPVYEQALEICYLLNDYSQAFYFLEKSKAVLLLDALFSINARKIISPQVAKEELLLQKKIFTTRTALENALVNNSNDMVALRAAMLQAQRTYDNFINELAQKTPKYFQAKYSKQIAALPDIQALLVNDSNYLLHYFYGDSAIYSLKVGKQIVSFKKTPRTPVIDTIISDFLSQFNSPNRNTIANNPKAFAVLSHQLFQSIFAPIWDGQGLTNGHGIIIPDGQISYIPFESLLYQKSEAKNLKSLPYLLNKQTFSYAYSATVLQQQFSKRQQKKLTTLGFAPFSDQKGNYGQLNFSKKELGFLEQNFEGQYFFNDLASTSAFKKHTSDFAILHCSTHASAAPQSGHPFIAFADTNLYLEDLYTFSLPAELVVLSACETGLGELKKGEGVISLARGFAYAGANRMISSLWRVNDAATTYIFTHFYDHLSKGETIAHALHQAKVDYLNDPSISNAKKSPYYWAGFVLVGEDQALDLAKNSKISYWQWILFIGILLGIFLLIQRKGQIRS